MATTYATNAEVRAKFPNIDNILPKTKLNGASTAPSSTLTVDHTESFPLSGKITLLDDANEVVELTYTYKTETSFLLSAATVNDFNDNTWVGTGDYQIDFFRELSKGWVDAKITNANVPAAHKKDLEIRYTYYQALKATMDSNLWALAEQILLDITAFIDDMNAKYPPAMTQTTVYRVEDNLTATERDIIANGEL